MNMSSPYQSIARKTIPDNAARIIELETEITLDRIKVTPIVATALDNVGEIKRSITVSHDNFRTWLEDNERLECVSNTSDHTGQHAQTTFEVSYTEYITSPPASFIEDLYDFLYHTGHLILPYVPA